VCVCARVCMYVCVSVSVLPVECRGEGERGRAVGAKLGKANQGWRKEDLGCQTEGFEFYLVVNGEPRKRGL
jgi:hypothetical protein